MPEENNTAPAVEAPSTGDLQQNAGAAVQQAQPSTQTQPVAVANQPQPAQPTVQAQSAVAAQSQPTPPQPITQAQAPQPQPQPAPAPVATDISPAPAEQTAIYSVPARGALSNTPNKQYSSPDPVPPSQIKHKKRKIGFLKPALISLAALFLIGGGATATYLGVIVPNRPDNVVAIALSKLIAYDTLGLDTATTVEVEDKTDSSNSGSITVDFNADANDEVAKIGFGIRDIQVNSGEISQEDLGDISGINVGAEVLLRNESEHGFVKIRGLDTLADFYTELAASAFGTNSSEDEEVKSSIDSFVSILQSDWIRIEVPQDESTDDPLDELAMCFEKAGEQLDFEQILGENYIENRFFVVKNDFGDADVNGEQMKHYEMTFSSEQFNNFANSVLDNVFANEDVKTCLDELSDGDMRADLNEATSELEDYDFDAWIDGGKNLRRIAFVYEDDTVKVIVTTDLTIREYRNFDFPDSFKTTEEIQQELEAEYEKLDETIGSSSNNSLDTTSSFGDKTDAEINSNAAKIVTLLTEYQANTGALPESTTSAEWSDFQLDYVFDDEQLRDEFVFISDSEPFFAGDLQYFQGSVCNSDNTSVSDSSSSNFAMLVLLNDDKLTCIDNN